MNKLLIAALALGAAGFVNSAISAPAIARLTPGDEGLMQKADDRDRDLKDDRSDRPGYWGKNPSWRDTRPWSDDEWRRDRDWDDNGPDMDKHD